MNTSRKTDKLAAEVSSSATANDATYAIWNRSRTILLTINYNSIHESQPPVDR